MPGLLPDGYCCPLCQYWNEFNSSVYATWGRSVQHTCRSCKKTVVLHQGEVFDGLREAKA